MVINKDIDLQLRDFILFGGKNTLKIYVRYSKYLPFLH